METLNPAFEEKWFEHKIELYEKENYNTAGGGG